MTRHEDDLSGTSVLHYSIRHLIGSGGMGQVYVARDEERHRDVAIKVMGHSDGAACGSRRTIACEGRMLSRLHHPHVAGVYEVLSHRGTDYLVMELVPGPTVRQLLTCGPLPVGEAVRLGRQLAEGLMAVHAARVLHRDLKPENLKITASGDLKILDFGIARALPCGNTPDLSTTRVDGELAGTLRYMSPEQLRGEDCDERADVYGAGAVLYEMISGTPPFGARQIACLIDAILHDAPPDLTRQCPSIPTALWRIISKALEKRPAARQQSARELCADLDGLLCPAVARVPAPPRRTGAAAEALL